MGGVGSGGAGWDVCGETWSDVFLVQSDLYGRFWAMWHFDGSAWREHDVIEDKPYVYRPAVLSTRGLLLSAAGKICLRDQSGWRQTPGLPGRHTWRMVQTGNGQIFAETDEVLFGRSYAVFVLAATSAEVELGCQGPRILPGPRLPSKWTVAGSAGGQN